jgi:hypothetical protein
MALTPLAVRRPRDSLIKRKAPTTSPATERISCSASSCSLMGPCLWDRVQANKKRAAQKRRKALRPSGLLRVEVV